MYTYAYIYIYIHTLHCIALHCITLHYITCIIIHILGINPSFLDTPKASRHIECSSSILWTTKPPSWNLNRGWTIVHGLLNGNLWLFFGEYAYGWYMVNILVNDEIILWETQCHKRTNWGYNGCFFCGNAINNYHDSGWFIPLIKVVILGMNYYWVYHILKYN